MSRTPRRHISSYREFVERIDASSPIPGSRQAEPIPAQPDRRATNPVNVHGQRTSQCSSEPRL
jgi:hypothetical protein